MRSFPRIYDYTKTASGTRPVTALEIAEHLKIDSDLITGDFKTYIESLIDAAVEFGERYTKREFSVCTFSAYLDGFIQGGIYEIRKCPLASITSIKYYSGGSESTLSTDAYYYAQSSTFSRLAEASGYSWPTSDYRLHAVSIIFTAGYATLPSDLKNAVMDHVGAMYVNRGDCEPGSTAGGVARCSLPSSVKNIYDMRKIRDIVVVI